MQQACRRLPENFRSIAHINVVCQTGGITVAGLDDCDVPGNLKRNESALIVGVHLKLTYSEQFVFERIAVGKDISV